MNGPSGISPAASLDAVEPLFLAPALKSALWGGHRLCREYGYHAAGAVAEAWVLSTHPAGESTVVGGSYDGQPLSRALGEHLPLLIKLIDAHAPLSVQVHPDDAYARRVEGQPGKTELWHILDCQPGATLLLGVNAPLTKEAFRRHIQDGTPETVCRRVPVQKGDTFLIPAGTLHAIGGGILLAEVQPPSDLTYRLYDYGRVDAHGNPRPLQADKALDVLNLTPQDTRQTLPVACPYFHVEKRTLTGAHPVGRADTFLSLVCLDGTGDLIWQGHRRPFGKGDSVLLPAGMFATVSGSAELLCSYK